MCAKRIAQNCLRQIYQSTVTCHQWQWSWLFRQDGPNVRLQHGKSFGKPLETTGRKAIGTKAYRTLSQPGC